MGSARALKERLLKAVEEDRELRYALMGLLGFKEVLERIVKLEEGQQRIEERIAGLEERAIKHEERVVELEERVIKLEERTVGLLEELGETRRIALVVAHRFGVLSEARFREAMKYVVQEVLGVAEVKRWVHRDEEGLVYGHPSIVEVDAVVKDREHFLIEVKSRVSKGDLLELSKVGCLNEKVVGVKPRLVVASGFVDAGVYEAASRMGVEVKPIIKEAWAPPS